MLWLTWKCCSSTWIFPCSGHFFRAKSANWKIISTICPTPPKNKISHICYKNIQLNKVILFCFHLVSNDSFSFNWVSEQTCNKGNLCYLRGFFTTINHISNPTFQFMSESISWVRSLAWPEKWREHALHSPTTALAVPSWNDQARDRASGKCSSFSRQSIRWTGTH